MEDTLFLSGSGMNMSDEVNDSTLQVNQYYNNTSNSDGGDNHVMGYFNTTLQLFFVLIGLPWNAMVIGIIFKKKLYTQPSLMLMLNLAIANLFVLVCNTPLTIIITIGHQFVEFEDFTPVCKTGVFITLFPLVSTHTIAMMSVDRVIYLKKPLTYHLIVTPWRMLAAIAVMWILSIALILSTLSVKELILHKNLISVDNCSAFVSKIWVAKLIMADFIVASLVQFVGCGCIIFITRTHLRKKLRRALNNSSIRKGESHTHAQSRRRSAVLKDYSKAHMSLVFVFGAIFVTGLVAVAPVVVSLAVSVIIGYHLPPYAFSTVYILYLSRSAINPILEVCLTHEIRSALCKLCTAGVIKTPTCCHRQKRVSAEEYLSRPQATPI